MVSACPKESDPKENVKSFVSDDSVRSISGLRSEGIEALAEVVMREISEQNPDSKILTVDRDMMSDCDMCFPNELKDYVKKNLTQSGKTMVFVNGDIPMNNWQTAFEGLSGIQVFYVSLACGHVPLCVKLF